MARGLFSGMLWGGIASGVVVAVVSLMAAEPHLLSPVAPEPAKVEIPDAAFTGEAEGAGDTAPQMPTPTEDTGSSMPATVPVAPTTDASSTPVADTAPGSPPDTPRIPALEAPEIVAPRLPQETAPEEPVLPSPQAMAPDAPVMDPPVAPGVEVPAQPAAVEPQATPDVALVVPAPAAEPASEPAPEPGAVDAPEAEPVPVPESAVVPALPTEPVPAPEENAQSAPEAPAAPSASPKPAPGLDNLAPGVLTNRLPRIGDTPAGAGEATDDATIPALIANAVPFEPTEDGPLMSVVLIDTGESEINAVSMRAFPFALTIAIDPAVPGAAEAAALYRDAGAEVVILTNIPEGAMPADLEVTFQSYLSMIPEAVAVLDVPISAVQKNRELAKQLTQILVSTGHGLLTFPKGLNSAQQEAKREGVKTGLIFRAVDNDRPAPEVLRRALDQAAFRAGQEGGVIVIGHTYPETIKTLLEWGVDDRAGGVVMAPVSAVLLTK